ncbi:MAG: hypothetical protein KKB50_08950 [Planctomycetes bacterium]|nr:hypothetical protein [Planctomycetota bacterium]
MLIAILTPVTSFHAALGGAGVLGLWGIQPWLFRKKVRPGDVTVDERDHRIVERGTHIGFAASYLAFVVACLIPWFYLSLYKDNETVSVHLLTVPVWIAFIVAMVGRAVAILLLYGREADDAGE